MMKLGYHEPRPFWITTNIQAFSCSSQFGNPSGHSSSSMGMAMVVWLDYLIESEWYLIERRKILEFLLAFAFGCTVGYSRMFLGVHSLDQVVYGILIGIWCAFTLQFCVRPALTQEAQDLVCGNIIEFK